MKNFDGSLSEKTVSLVIPTKNNASTIKLCLDGIFSQRCDCSVEVVVVDSGSTDGTLDILKRYPIKLHQIKPEEFNHGGTRYIGAGITRGEFIVMTVADAYPANEHWLASLLAHFADPIVMAVTGQQIAPVGEAFNPMQRYKPIIVPQVAKYHFQDATGFDKLCPEEKGSYCAIDDVTAAYRRSAFLELPFEEVMFGEDMLWAREALRRGWGIVFDPNALVFHYHEQTIVFSFKRQFIETWFFILHLGFVFPSHRIIRKTLSSIYWLMQEDCTYSTKFKWFIYNLKANIAAFFGALFAYCVLKLFSVSQRDKIKNLVCKTAPTPK